MASTGVTITMLKHSIMTLVAIGAGLMSQSGTQASAFTGAPQPVLQSADSPLLVEVRDGGQYGRNYNGNYRRGYNGYTTYNRNIHGNRCGNWSNNCRYRHGNYWYASPWWALPVVGAGIAIGAYDGGYAGNGNRHVNWCMNRYNSYNPRSNTWMSYGGRLRQCVSPYGA